MDEKTARRLEALQEVRSVLPKLLSAEKAAQIERQLSAALDQPGEPMFQAIQACEALQPHDPAMKFLNDILDELEGMQEKGIRFEPTPAGAPLPIAPGPEYRCPIDPKGCPPRYLRIQGQRLRCPKHNVDLVPAAQIQEDKRNVQ